MNRLFGVVLCVIFLSGCATYYNDATGRREMSFTSINQEETTGKSTIASLLKGKKIVKSDRAFGVANRIAMNIKPSRTPKKLVVYEDAGIQAFNAGGGYVAVTSGLIATATDAELAAVIAHEMGHDEARHVMKHTEAAVGLQSVMVLGYFLDQRAAGVKDADWKQWTEATKTAYALVNNGFSRADEYEADRLSIRYMRQAGYDPNAIITFLEKLKRMGNDTQWNIFLRSHPFLDDRIAAARKEIANLFKPASP